MKKLVSLIGAGALLLSVAGPALAIPMYGSDNYATVNNTSVANANTGGNSQSNVADVSYGGGVTVNGADGKRTINTGNARAYSGALVVANTHVGCDSCVTEHDDDVASVNNTAVVGADSGSNGQDDLAVVSHGGGVTVDGGTGERKIETGNARAKSRAWTVVNTHVGL